MDKIPTLDSAIEEVLSAISARVKPAKNASKALDAFKKDPYDTDTLFKYQIAFGFLRAADERLALAQEVKTSLIRELSNK